MAMVAEFEEGQDPFGQGEWVGPGLLFDEGERQELGFGEEERRSGAGSGSGGFPRRADVGENIAGQGDEP